MSLALFYNEVGLLARVWWTAERMRWQPPPPPPDFSAPTSRRERRRWARARTSGRRGARRIPAPKRFEPVAPMVVLLRYEFTGGVAVYLEREPDARTVADVREWMAKHAQKVWSEHEGLCGEGEA